MKPLDRFGSNQETALGGAQGRGKLWQIQFQLVSTNALKIFNCRAGRMEADQHKLGQLKLLFGRVAWSTNGVLGLELLRNFSGGGIGGEESGKKGGK